MLINLGEMKPTSYADGLIWQSYTGRVIADAISRRNLIIPKALVRIRADTIDSTDLEVYEGLWVVRQIANGCRRTLC